MRVLGEILTIKSIAPLGLAIQISFRRVSIGVRKRATVSEP